MGARWNGKELLTALRDDVLSRLGMPTLPWAEETRVVANLDETTPSAGPPTARAPELAREVVALARAEALTIPGRQYVHPLSLRNVRINLIHVGQVHQETCQVDQSFRVTCNDCDELIRSIDPEGHRNPSCRLRLTRSFSPHAYSFRIDNFVA